MRFFLLFVSIIMFAGCLSLPPGKAPTGSIVESKLPTEKYSWLGAENHMLTSLSIFCIQNFSQGSSFNIDFQTSNKNLVSCSQAVLRSVRDSTPIRLLKQTQAAYRLSSKINNKNIWSMRLVKLKTKKIVWAENVTIEGDGI